MEPSQNEGSICIEWTRCEKERRGVFPTRGALRGFLTRILAWQGGLGLDDL
jgi:hypothetical protein